MKKVLVRINNKPFYTYSAACRYNKINLNTFETRRYRLGWSIQEALGLKQRLNNKKEIKFKNYHFESRSEACKFFNIHNATANYRIKKGWTYEEIFILKKRKKYIFKKKIFSSLASASKYYGIPYDTVNQRIRVLKWSPEEALELKSRKDSRKGSIGYIYKIKNLITKKIYVGATTQSPWKRWASHKVDAVKKNSIKSDKTIGQSILKYGTKNFRFSILKKIKTSIFDIQKLERKFIKKYNSMKPNGYNQNRGGSIYFTHGISIKYNGIKYKSLRQLASKFKLKYSLLASRIAKGYSIEKAIKEPIKFSKPIRIIDGKKFYMIKDILKHLKIPISTYDSRIERGWTFDEAINQKEKIFDKKNFVKNIFFKYKNKKFKSVVSAANFFKIKPNLVSQRIMRGWSKEEALNLKKN